MMKQARSPSSKGYKRISFYASTILK